MPSNTCRGCKLPTCGDGILDEGEECDALNLPTETCRVDCTTMRCGDAILDTNLGEACDEGSDMPTATCREDCTIPRCGDSILDEGEQCDEGGATETCRATCQRPVCGDGT